VVRPDGMGDMVLAGPAIRALAASSSRLLVLGSPSNVAVARLLPGVDAVREWRCPWIAADAPGVTDTTTERVVEWVRLHDVQRAAVLCSSHQSPLPTALLLRCAGVETIAAVSHDYAGSLLDARIVGDPAMHEVERNLAVASALGASLPCGDDGRLRVSTSAAAPLAVPAGTGSLVAVHPGASVPARTATPRRWRAVVAALTSAGHRVVVTGSMADAALVREVVGTSPALPSCSPEVAELAAVLGAVDVVVAGNTGPAHLAAAVGTPVVSLFPPTVDHRRWHPWGVPHVLLGDLSIPCAGCRSQTCPRADARGEQPCIAGVDESLVVDAVGELIALSPSTSSLAAGRMALAAGEVA
jgi:ADP-heptose:LPS heptosyltransferase